MEGNVSREIVVTTVRARFESSSFFDAKIILTESDNRWFIDK